MKLSIASIIETASKLKTKEDKVDYLRKNYNTGVGLMLKLAFNKDLEWDLPEGSPPYKESEITDNEGMLYDELRRIYIFHKGQATEVSKARKEILFQQLIESVDKKDAVLLLAVKEKKIPSVYKGITQKLVEEAYPTLLVY